MDDIEGRDGGHGKSPSREAVEMAPVLDSVDAVTRSGATTAESAPGQPHVVPEAPGLAPGRPEVARDALDAAVAVDHPPAIDALDPATLSTALDLFGWSESDVVGLVKAASDVLSQGLTESDRVAAQRLLDELLPPAQQDSVTEQAAERGSTTGDWILGALDAILGGLRDVVKAAGIVAGIAAVGMAVAGGGPLAILPAARLIAHVAAMAEQRHQAGVAADAGHPQPTSAPALDA